MDLVKNMLVELGYIVADPRELGPVIVDSAPEAKTPEFFKGIFDGNIKGMDQSYMIVASLDDKDIGTAFELGYFYQSLKYAVSFSFDGGKTNVMLGQSVDSHFTSFDDIKDFFKSYRREIIRRDEEFLFNLFDKERNLNSNFKKAEADE